jgi:hypothetical protein
MNISELKIRLKEINDLGDVQTLRTGNTGVGYTLECLLGIEENNNRTADIEGNIELKAKRKGTSARTTSFTQSPIWLKSTREIIKKYGWSDKEKPERINFYPSLRYGKSNPQGLHLKIDRNELFVMGRENEILCSLPIEVIQFCFRRKFPNLMMVLADRKKEKGQLERFHFNEAYYCTNITPESVIKLLKEGKMAFEFRIWMDKETGRLRDRGMAVRLSSEWTKSLFKNVERII